MAESEIIEKADQFEETPDGWQKRWTVEMAASKKDLEAWWKQGDDVVRRYLDDRRGSNASMGDTRVNLFTANVQTQRALLYGKTPSVDVKRRFADAGDDAARGAGEMLQRLLNTDIERDSDTYAVALEYGLDDRLLAGMGSARLRYEVEEQEQEAVPAIKHPVTGEELASGYQPDPIVTKEEVEVDYVHWKDQRWSPCRNFNEVRWWAFKADMGKDDLEARFGEEKARDVPMRSKAALQNDFDGNKNDPWSRAEVWEIWSKEHRKVFWFVEGAREILDVKDDTLGLDGFWPFPRPMMANCTTSKLIPVPDLVIALDLYNEIDSVSTRITNLERAIQAKGCYDSTSTELKNLLSNATANDMIPVDNFAAFAEKGGVQGVVSWLPLDIFVAALDKLREYRTELMGLLFQVTGMSDIMRGQSSGQTTATEQAIKAKFASVRMQAFQAEFARFASDILALKAEIIAKHFTADTIIKRSNAEYMGLTPEQMQQAVQIIKTDVYQYRVSVKPEAISMQDYSAIKQERGEMLTAVATYLQSSMPVMQAAPQLTPMLLQLLQWAVAGFRGGATIEGAIDQAVVQAIKASQMPKPPPPPDPKVVAQQQKMQMDQQSHQMDMAGKQADLRFQAQKANLDLTVAQQKARVDLAKAAADHQMSLAEHELNVRQTEHQLQADATKGALDAEVMKAKHDAQMQSAKETKEAKDG